MDKGRVEDKGRVSPCEKCSYWVWCERVTECTINEKEKIQKKKT